MEGIALEIASLLGRIERRIGQRMKRLVLGGGGAASDVWCQILADALDRPCFRPDTLETASLGAAMCAMAACSGRSVALVAKGIRLSGKTFRPTRKGVETYRTLKMLYGRLYPDTRRLCNALARAQMPDGP